MTKTKAKIEQIMASPVHSFWLKNALKTALQRDCCDAASDAELLVEILVTVANEQLDIRPDKDRDGAMGMCSELGID